MSHDEIKIYTIPGSGQNGQEGSIRVFRLFDRLWLFVIDIHSQTLPPLNFESLPDGKMVKFNYCRHGRCELVTCSGAYTYLAGGEAALDTGQAENKFYYPSSEYFGLELIFFMDDTLCSIPSLGSYADVLKNAGLQRIDALTQPLIFPADDILTDISDSIRVYIENGLGINMLRLKGLELLLWLARLLPEKQPAQRKFHTRSQAEIARGCYDLITEDLSRRWSARMLADRFQISEISVKNYFRSVYGYGFLEFQTKIRMETAAKKLTDSRDSVGCIAHDLGYSSQTKFGNAFRNYYGCLPLEYRLRSYTSGTSP